VCVCVCVGVCVGVSVSVGVRCYAVGALSWPARCALERKIT
jgi:hypothetical protein